MRIIKHVGNYGEIFERNVGAGLEARHRPRPQRAVDQGRHPIRAADPLIAAARAGGDGHRTRKPPSQLSGEAQD